MSVSEFSFPHLFEECFYVYINGGVEQDDYREILYIEIQRIQIDRMMSKCCIVMGKGVDSVWLKTSY